MSSPANYVPPVSDEPWDWLDAIEATIADGSFSVVTQPVVDLARGTVVGYEALTRFGGSAPSPAHWFAIADRLGLGAELAGRVIERQLDLRAHVPPSCFLAVNVPPVHLAADPVQRALAARSLDGLVLELTEHERVHDLPALRYRIDALRARGAMIALDDSGAGYSGLQALLELAPDVVKLDRSLVDGIHDDEAKVALVETTGALLSRIDAWLLAEGIEREAELEVLVQLGVPLGQGYFFGRPAPGWPRPDASVLARANSTQRSASSGTDVAAMMDDAPVVVATAGAPNPVPADGTPWVIVVDERRRPLEVRAGDDVRPFPSRRHEDLQTVKPGESPADVVERALTRTRDHRLDPLVCTDVRGRALGLVPIERLVREVARQARRAGSAEGSARRA